MNWYYVDAGQQAGPVPDEQLDELVRNGKVRGDTLVWRDGQANWQPYSQARPTGVQPTARPVIATAPPPTPTPDTEVVYAAVAHHAGFWIRFVAKLIDWIIIRVISIPLFTLLGGSMLSPPPQLSLGWLLTPRPIDFIPLLVLVVFDGFFIGKFGATPGKMALGLRVVTEHGTRVSLGRAFGRSSAEVLSFIICLIGYIIAAFEGQKRGLHDHIAATRVIRTRL